MEGGKKRITLPLVTFESKVPVIKLYLGDRDIFVLADTGSETTLIDKELKGKKGIHSKRLNTELGFVGMNGESEKVPVVLLKGGFHIGTTEVELCGVSADISNISAHFKDSYDSAVVISVLLGCDFLNSHNAIIDFEKQEMSFEL